jgi:hypothetical protein
MKKVSLFDDSELDCLSDAISKACSKRGLESVLIICYPDGHKRTSHSNIEMNLIDCQKLSTLLNERI